MIYLFLQIDRVYQIRYYIYISCIDCLLIALVIAQVERHEATIRELRAEAEEQARLREVAEAEDHRQRGLGGIR